MPPPNFTATPNTTNPTAIPTSTIAGCGCHSYDSEMKRHTDRIERLMDELQAEIKKMNEGIIAEQNRHKEALFAIAAPLLLPIAYGLAFLFCCRLVASTWP
jgi:hypothetical protein